MTAPPLPNGGRQFPNWPLIAFVLFYQPQCSGCLLKILLDGSLSGTAAARESGEERSDFKNKLILRRCTLKVKMDACALV